LVRVETIKVQTGETANAEVTVVVLSSDQLTNLLNLAVKVLSQGLDLVLVFDFFDTGSPHLATFTLLVRV
jgi:hypothetical protein